MKWNVWVFAILISVALANLVSFAAGLQLGGDEGLELSKAFQLWGNKDWIEGVWNDQPWLFTLFIKTAFAIFGPSAWAARSISIGCLVLLLVSVASFIPRGGWGGVLGLGVAWLALLGQPFTCQLAVSAMQELPAFAFATAGLAIANSRSSSIKYVIGSGILFGIAVQLKFTAMLFAPAVFVCLLMGDNLSSKNNPRNYSCLRPVRALGTWSLAFVSVIFLVFMIGPQWHWDQLCGTHWNTINNTVAGGPQQYKPNWFEILKDVYWLLPLVLITSLWFPRQGECKCLVLLSVALATVIFAHAMYRPYWEFYRLHLNIPLAILAGYSTSLFFRTLAENFRSPGNLAARWMGIRVSIMLACLSLVTAGGIDQIAQQILWLRSMPSASDSLVVAQMRKYAARTRWVFTKNNIYAFYAKLPVPPKLMIITKKRFWTHQINEDEIFAQVVRASPEQILVDASVELKEARWRDFLNAQYVRVLTETGCELYIAKRLDPTPILPDTKNEALLQSLGLGVQNTQPASRAGLTEP